MQLEKKEGFQSEALTPGRPRDGPIGGMQTGTSMPQLSLGGGGSTEAGFRGGLQPPVFNQRTGRCLRLHADGGAVKGAVCAPPLPS